MKHVQCTLSKKYDGFFLEKVCVPISFASLGEKSMVGLFIALAKLTLNPHKSVSRLQWKERNE